MKIYFSVLKTALEETGDTGVKIAEKLSNAKADAIMFSSNSLMSNEGCFGLNETEKIFLDISLGLPEDQCVAFLMNK